MSFVRRLASKAKDKYQKEAAAYKQRQHQRQEQEKKLEGIRKAAYEEEVKRQTEKNARSDARQKVRSAGNNNVAYNSALAGLNFLTSDIFTPGTATGPQTAGNLNKMLTINPPKKQKTRAVVKRPKKEKTFEQTVNELMGF